MDKAERRIRDAKRAAKAILGEKNTKRVKQVLRVEGSRAEQKILRQEKQLADRTGKLESRITVLESRTKKNGAEMKKIREEVQREFRRRDLWAQRKAEVRHLARGRRVCVIKCPAPDSPARERWGDWNYCMMLKRNLEREGLYVIVDCYEDWYCDSGAELVIVMRGLYGYRPDRRNENCRYILWIVSHPDQVTDEECALYDQVWVDSVSGQDVLAERLPVPVRTEIVPVDTELFCPASPARGEKDKDKSDEPFYPRVFVGNARGIRRNVTEWCERNDITLHVWGTGWDRLYPDSRNLIFHDPAPYDQVPEIYRHAKVILNDHYEDMLAMGYVNNRLPEVLACGQPIVSDGGRQFGALFSAGVLYYEDEKSFLECIRRAETEYDALRQDALAALPALREKLAASVWARRIREMLEK